MAVVISGGGSLTSTLANLDATAQLRYIRATFHNSGTLTRTITVNYGSQEVYTFQLAPQAERTVGPQSLPSGTNPQAKQDSGTDVTYRVTGEY